jgi:hypothetical protein
MGQNMKEDTLKEQELALVNLAIALMRVMLGIGKMII